VSGDSEDDDREEAVYKTYLQPLRVPDPEPAAGPAPPPPDPDPAVIAQPEATPLPGLGDDEEAALYKTYVAPIRVPVPRAEPAPPPPPPAPEPAAVTSPEPLPQEPRSAAPKAADVPPPAAKPVKDFEFRRGQARRGRRVLVRALGAVVVAVGLALAYPLVHPFGSSSSPGKSLTQYLGRVQPIVQRAAADRKSVQAAVNAVRRNPKGRKSAERQLVRANNDRLALIGRLNALGSAPRVAGALPARLTSLLRGQIQTARVWQRWMGRRTFVYLKDDAATRNRVQSLLRSQQASKGAFTRLYAQLMRAAGLPLAGGVGI
jgi:hypothetical protein